MIRNVKSYVPNTNTHWFCPSLLIQRAEVSLPSLHYLRQHQYPLLSCYFFFFSVNCCLADIAELSWDSTRIGRGCIDCISHNTTPLPTAMEKCVWWQSVSRDRAVVFIIVVLSVLADWFVTAVIGGYCQLDCVWSPFFLPAICGSDCGWDDFFVQFNWGWLVHTFYCGFSLVWIFEIGVLQFFVSR